MHELLIFVRQLTRTLCFVHGVLLALLCLLVAFALIIAVAEDLPMADSFYFTFITALTVGFGDITPETGIGRVISVLSGIVGVIFAGLIVAASVRALHDAADEERQLRAKRSKTRKSDH